MKVFVLRVELPEGSDEFWDAIRKRSGRKEVVAAVRGCLEWEGFYDCKIKCEDVLKRSE